MVDYVDTPSFGLRALLQPQSYRSVLELLTVVLQINLIDSDPMNSSSRQRLPSTGRPRDLMKCERCRRDKQACRPSGKLENGRQEKCKRCCDAGYDCGSTETRPRMSGWQLMALHDSHGLPHIGLSLHPNTISLSTYDQTNQHPTFGTHYPSLAHTWTDAEHLDTERPSDRFRRFDAHDSDAESQSSTSVDNEDDLYAPEAADEGQRVTILPSHLHCEPVSHTGLTSFMCRATF